MRDREGNLIDIMTMCSGPIWNHMSAKPHRASIQRDAFMHIRVIIYGSLLRPEGKHDFSKEVADGATVKDVIIALGYQPQHVTTILTTVNGLQASHNLQLKEDDEIVLSVMIGGG